MQSPQGGPVSLQVGVEKPKKYHNSTVKNKDSKPRPSEWNSCLVNTKQENPLVMTVT